jgi:hypothetical protein
MAAFHFRADAGVYGPVWVQSVQEIFFRILGSSDGRVHAEIFTGDLLVHNIARDEAARETILEALTGYNPRKWRAIENEEFAAALFSARVYVLAVQGLSDKLQDHVDAALRRNGAYLGAIEIDPGNRVHWGLYRRSLIPRYRYVDGEIRIYYRKFEEEAGADVKDTGTAEDWKRRGFRVTFEDSGVRHTIFDRYQSFEDSTREASLERQLSEHLAGIADEILLRLSASDSRLKDTLHAAFRAFERIETVDDIAQVAVSCRRFLEGLANMLYPPREGLVRGRKVSTAEYRNRLWAYVEESLGGEEQKLTIAQLEDVGRRIDALDRLSNKGVHDRISRPDVHRLMVALLVLAFDLVSRGAVLVTPGPVHVDNAGARRCVHRIVVAAGFVQRDDFARFVAEFNDDVAKVQPVGTMREQWSVHALIVTQLSSAHARRSRGQEFARRFTHRRGADKASQFIQPNAIQLRSEWWVIRANRRTQPTHAE